MWYSHKMEYLAIKMKYVTWHNMGEPRRHHVNEKKPDTKGHIFYDFIQMEISRMGKSRDRKHISGFKRLERRELAATWVSSFSLR